MHKFILTFVLLFGFGHGIVEAKVLRLHSGNTVEGTLVEETDDYYLIEMNGFMMTYYKDDVAEAVDNWTDLSSQEGVEPSDAMAELDNVIYSIEQQNQEGDINETKFSSNDVQLTETEKKIINDMDKRDLIIKFMDVFGTRATLRIAYQRMIQELPPEQVETVKNSVTVESIVEELLPLYDRYFTAEELRKYVAFYGSIEGRKLLRTVPILMQESVKRSMEHFRKKIPQSIR